MKLVLAGLLFTQCVAFGGESPRRQISPKRAKEIFLAEYQDDLRFDQTLRYKSRIEFTHDPAKNTTAEWAISEDPVSGPVRATVFRAGSPAAVHMLVNGVRFVALRANHAEYDWTAWTDPRGGDEFRAPAFDPVHLYARPLYGCRWRELLEVYPPIEAWADDSGIEFLCLMNGRVRGWLESGAPISGCLGARIRVEPVLGRHRVVSVEILETSTEFSDESPTDGELAWRDNPRLMPEQGVHQFLDGRIECGIQRRIDFREFRRFGQAVIPLVCAVASREGSMVVTIDEETILYGEPGDLFAFSPPEEFGPRGYVLDSLTGQREFVGFRPDPVRAIQRMVSHSDDLGASGHSSKTLRFWLIVLGLAAALGIGWRLRRLRVTRARVAD